ncbi:PTS sugar transporter subunit IIA [Geobacillus stearothermophilus]|uniref:BglG family transcription antiterminator n=1 Tax=Geobacillus stearothermophilus TaxID=1422 RepID=UPI002E1A1E49|nr:PTS sugar transporter subunit IIA [Geobacillus stearothermophilus]
MDEKVYHLLLLILEHSHRRFSIQELSDELNFSDKTIRNYLKQLDVWLSQHSSCQIIRKPNQGIWIEGTKEDIERLKKYLKQNRYFIIEQEKRKTELMNILFTEPNPLSIKELSQRFFCHSDIIKKELEMIHEELKRQQVSLTIRQKEGVHLVGEESCIRNAYVHFLLHLWRSGGNQALFSFIERQTYDLLSFYTRQLLSSCDLHLTDEAYVKFVLCVFFTIQRIKKKHFVSGHTFSSDSFELDMSSFFSQIERSFACHLPLPEKQYLHSLLVSSRQLLSEQKSSFLSTDSYEFVKWFLTRLSERLSVPFTEDKELIEPLSYHVHTTLERIKHHLPIHNPMKEKIRTQYYPTFLQIYSLLEEEAPERLKQFKEDEVAYLTLYIESSLERLQQMDGKNKRVVIACSMGMSASMLLKTKLERKFHSLHIVKSVSFSQLKSVIEKEEVDFVICTNEPEQLDIPYIVLSPVLDKEEEQRLLNFIASLDEKRKTAYPLLKQYLSLETTFTQVSCSNPIDAIRMVCDSLSSLGYITNHYKDSVIQRESLSSTIMENEVMIPHGNDKEVLRSTIAIVQFKKPVTWNQKTVSLMFLLALKPSEVSHQRALFHELLSVCEDKSFIQELKNAVNPSEMLQFF